MSSNSLSVDPLSYMEIDLKENPQTILANRAPITNDVQNKNTAWVDQSVTPNVIYESVGSGVWQVTSGADVVPDASTTIKGKVELATDAEAVVGSDALKAITPASLTARLESPNAIGTTDAANQVTSINFDTDDAAAGLRMTGTSIVAQGTDVNIPVSLQAKGTSDVQIVNSDLDVQGGNVIISGAGNQLQVVGSAVTDFIGTAILVAGTVTIANTNIAATDRIFVQRGGVNASTTLGELDVSISASTSFTITALQAATPGSTETGDLSDVFYFIVRQV